MSEGETCTGDTEREYVDIRDIHPDWSEMECWNCGHSERVGPNRHMRICHNCFIDNSPTEHETSSTVEGPDGELYTDYRRLWYGDIPVGEAQQRYETNTKGVRERGERERARERVVRL